MAEPPVIRHPADLVPLIDNTIRRPDATSEMARRCYEEARTHGFRAVCGYELDWEQVGRGADDGAGATEQPDNR
jgi:deoxyribose-phosphate aldolase